MPAHNPKQVSESQPQTINCDRHGDSVSCLICCHLREGTGLGYWAINADPQGPAQAWCEECDMILAEDRGWTDRGDLFADWKLYCTGCYAEALARHTQIGWDSGGVPTVE